MTAPTCDACTRPVADQARLCQGCTDRLARELGDVGALAAELTTTRLKQDQMGGVVTGVLSRSSDTSLPWNQHAAEVADALRATVVGWVRVVQDERGWSCQHPSCDAVLPRCDRWQPTIANTMQALSGHLLRADVLEWLRHHQDAAECADEIGDAVGRARNAIDRGRERIYLGPCREDVDAHDDHGPACCVAELHGRKGAKTAVCERCAASHDVRERRLWLQAVAENQYATVAQIVSLLGTEGRPLSPNTVKSWVKRQQLVRFGSSEPALFRVGDAIALAFPARESA